MTPASLLGLAVMLLLFSSTASAHCPLCVAGAGAVTGGAMYLGVEKIVVALFIGAFAVAMGLWAARKLPGDYLPYQEETVTAASFLLTVLPLTPVIRENAPYYLSIAGSYGSLLNRTYLIDLSLLTAVLGGAIVYLSPYFSRKISGLRGGRTAPFQGLTLTFALLLIAGTGLQVI